MNKYKDDAKNKELFFESNLNFPQIQENFKKIDFFKGIMTGLEEALEYEKKTFSNENAGRYTFRMVQKEE